VLLKIQVEFYLLTNVLLFFLPLQAKLEGLEPDMRSDRSESVYSNSEAAAAHAKAVMHNDIHHSV
jgi:hypothetical protein